jgi:hypothetical protein
MQDIGSWAWLIIAIFVVVTRVLPRLFRGKKGDREEVPSSTQTQAPEPAATEGGPMTDFDTLISTLKEKRFTAPGRSEAPPPIVPK